MKFDELKWPRTGVLTVEEWDDEGELKTLVNRVYLDDYDTDPEEEYGSDELIFRVYKIPVTAEDGFPEKLAIEDHLILIRVVGREVANYESEDALFQEHAIARSMEAAQKYLLLIP